MTPENTAPIAPAGVDTDKPSAARVYDWYLGGNHHWAVDREFGRRVEKVWPLSYRGQAYGTKKMSFYPSEGTVDPIARPAGGYVWDRAKEAGVSYRSYGEWIANG